MLLQRGVVSLCLLLRVRAVSQVWLRERARMVASFKYKRALCVAARAEPEQRTRRQQESRVEDGCKSRTMISKALGGSAVWSIV